MTWNTYDFHENYPIFKTPYPLVICFQTNFFHPLDLRRPISNKAPSTNDTVHLNERNQNKKNKSYYIQTHREFYCSI